MTRLYHIKFHIKTFLVMAILTFSSCSGDFLEIIPVDAVLSENFFQTEDQIRRALNGAYSPLGNRGMYGWWLSPIREILSDDVNTLEQGIINHHFFNPTNTDRQLFTRKDGDGLWKSIFMGVLRSNLIIIRTPESQIPSQIVKNQLIGEAKFLRAMYYFHLASFWNKGPLLLDDNFNAVDVRTSSAEEIHEAIERDLLDIIEGNWLPWTYDGSPGKEIGRASMGASLSLLGKLYLYQGRFQEAAALFKQVIDRNVYSLIPIEEVYTLQGDNGSESVFEVQFNYKGAGFNPFFDDGVNASESTLRNQMLAPNQVGGWENLWPSQNFVDQLDNDDPRGKLFIIFPGDPIPGSAHLFNPSLNKGSYSIRKGVNSGYSAWNPQGGVADENFPLIRYADVLLMYAECLIRSNTDTDEAMRMIDQVRARAYRYDDIEALKAEGKGVSSVMVQRNLSLFEVLKLERRIELSFEGHRYLDLLRWNDAASNEILLSRGWAPEKAYYPISQEDLDLTSLLTP